MLLLDFFICNFLINWIIILNIKVILNSSCFSFCFFFPLEKVKFLIWHNFKVPGDWLVDHRELWESRLCRVVRAEGKVSEGQGMETESQTMISVSCCCYNNKPQIRGIKTTQIYSLTALAFRSPKYVLVGWKQGVRRAAFLLETLGKNPFPSFFKVLEATSIP